MIVNSENRANGIRVYTRKPGEWNSRLYRQNPPTRVEELTVKIT